MSAFTSNVVVVLTSGTSWTVPSNWSNSNNIIYLIGGGGGGGGIGGNTPGGTYQAGGGGGGGGGFTKIINFSATPGSNISYSIGSGGSSAGVGSSGGNGGSTTFNSGAYTAGGGGGGGTSNGTANSVGGVGGTGSTYNGGTGGTGSSTTTKTQVTGGGGGGAAGPGGNGGNGANANNTVPGGGGGNGGGGNASGRPGGTGINGGTGGTGGTGATPATNGGSSTDIVNNYSVVVPGIPTSAGSGGGGGGSGYSGSGAPGIGGYYGGGGGGGAAGASGNGDYSASGAQGIIVIVYGTQSNTVTRLTNTGTFLTNGILDEVTNFIPGGGGSLSFNGTNKIANTTANLKLSTSSTPFTVEAWIYPTTVTGFTSGEVAPVLVIGNESSGRMSFGIATSAVLAYNNYGNGNETLSSSGAIVANVWQHIAFVSNGTTVTGYINGVSSGSFTIGSGAAGVIGNATGFYVGQGSTGYTVSNSFSGYITNIRYVNGTAVYTSNFIPSTQPLTTITNTQLLLDVVSPAAYITDSSINNFTLTNTNGVTYSPVPALKERYSTAGYLISGILDEITYSSTAPVIKNLLTYSQDFTQWGKNASPNDYTVVTNSIAAPNGKITADLIVKSTGAGTSSIVFKLFTGSINTTYCGSIYVKADGYSKVQVNFGNSAFNNTNIGATIDLTSGTIHSILNSSTVVVQNVGNGWYRISVTATSGASGGNYVFAFQPLDNTYNTNFAGDGTSGIYVWGAQVELGSVATIYQGISASNTLVSPGFSKRIGNDGSSYVTNIFDEVTGIS